MARTGTVAACWMGRRRPRRYCCHLAQRSSPGRKDPLNWIEAEFAALRYFALNGTDQGSHAEQNAAIVGHVRWHLRVLRRSSACPGGPPKG